MRNSERLPALTSAQQDELLCHKYWGQVLGQLAMDEHFHRVALPHDCDPERFSQICGNNLFTPDEYLAYLGKQGFNTSKIKAGVEELHKSIDDSREKAQTFFKIFQTEWFIEKSEVEKYLDNMSIHHFIELVVADAASTKARLKAVKRHTENRAMKQDVFAWLDENMANFKSMDSAAESVARTVAPIKFRTARDWVGEWKKLRSSARP